MEPDFARYIEIVGKNKVKESLKDKLQEAIKKSDHIKLTLVGANGRSPLQNILGKNVTKKQLHLPF